MTNLRSKVTRFCMSSVFILIISSSVVIGSANPCPSLNVEVPENTPIGTVLFSFNSSAAANIALLPKDGSRFNGYLALRRNVDRSYSIYLSKSLDLNTLNPRPTPVPITNEVLQCNSSSSNLPTPETVYRTVEYKMHCDVRHGESTVPVRSDVIVAIEDLNDNRPNFLCAPYHKRVNELTPVFTTVFTLKGLAADLDIDGGIAGYGLSGGGDGYFTLSGGASEGYIVLQKPLDYDYGRTAFVLNVTTTDIGDPPRTNWAQLHIQVTDGDDQNPAFSDDIYTLTLPEMDESIIGQPVETTPPLRAWDMDQGLNATVRYSLEAGHKFQGQTYFRLDPDTGLIIPLHELKRAEKPQFILSVKAYQADNPQNRVTSTTLIITVQDRNIHPPRFVPSEYNVTLPENAPAGYQLLQLRAEDDDFGTNAVVRYHITDMTGTFTIDATSGSISVQNNDLLDRETRPVLSFTVYAEEMQTYERYRSNNATVRVTLQDENDNSPVFQNMGPAEMYYFSADKTSVSGTLVGSISASDPDEGLNGQVRYTVLYGSENAMARFVVDPVSGGIRTRASLDQPYLSSYAMTVQAFDQAPAGMRSAVAIVNITVRADNIHSPKFVSTPYMTTISEASSVGTIVFTVQAEDADSPVLLYHISGGNTGDVFTMQRYSGVISLWRPLDRETKDTYSLIVVVSDNLNRAETEVVIRIADVNDNDPLFGQLSYNFEVVEEQGSGLEVGAVQAIDDDLGVNADIRYELGQDWAKDFFTMDSKSGLIQTTQTMDRERQASYQFLVVARDRGTQSRSGTATVVVHILDVNDQPPMFHQARYEVAILETSEPQVILQVKATDKDVPPFNEIRYTISSGKTNMFGIDPITGRISTKIEADLGPNSPHLSQEILVIRAYNTRRYHHQNIKNATTTVVVNFVDVNNNKPVFTEKIYRVDVMENAAIGSSLISVLAQDYDTSEDNRQVTYWMESNDPVVHQKFHVEKSTGVIRLMQPLNADPPANNVNFVFKVLASDLRVSSLSRSIENASAVVNISVIDVNDERPQFTQDFYEVIISEDTPVGAIVLSDLHAEDKDRGRNGEIMYFIQAVDVPFEVDPKVGHLSVKRSLDYDNIEHQTYSLEIIAVDKGQLQLTGTVTVEIYLENVNDNSPVFKPQRYNFDIVENLPNGTLVGQVSALDADHDTVEYTLLDNRNYFRINNSTGHIYTTQPLDFEEKNVYTLNISGVDAFNSTGFAVQSRHTTFTQVSVNVIDQNDNYPVFEQKKYRVTVREGTDSQVLLQVSATDGDEGVSGEVRYAIVAGNEQDIFGLDEKSGQLELVQGRLLNYQQKRLHHLVVQAKDGGQPSLAGMADVFVTVEDTNDRVPVFPFEQYKAEVSEDSPVGHTVIQILASDEDSDSEITYRMSPSSVPFNIDRLTGDIITTQNLDREATPSYILEITASDGQHEAQTVLAITVTDVNDHSPVFALNRYSKMVSPRTGLGQVVLSVSATDIDYERNGAVSYWISGGLGLFDINPVSGDISVAGDLSKHTSKPIVLSVYARDHGYPSLVSNASVYLYLNGSNAYRPEFSQFVYKVAMDENSNVGEVVLTLTATDLDSGTEGQVTIDIADGNVDDVFSIDNAGSIKLAKSLDHETKNRYELTVRATDGGTEPKSSTALVQVMVNDMNDNAPQFLVLPGSITMQGPLLQSEPITILVAKDSDGSKNNQVTYSLQNWNDQFLLDSKTGELNVSTVIQGGTFNITVRASDNGFPPLSTEATFMLRVLRLGSVSEQALFDRLAYQVKVPETSRVPLLLLDLNARQQNGQNDQGVTYSISGGHDRSYFQINPETGELSLVKTLNFSAQSTHSLLIKAFTRSDVPLSEAVVVVNVQDTNTEPPRFEFSKYTAEVREDFQVGDPVVTLVAHDLDQNAVLHYKIIQDDSRGKFKIFIQANKGVIRLTERLDRDTMPLSSAGIYRLMVNVTDGFNDSGPVSVLIKVIDMNDNSPVFPEEVFNISVKESVGPCQEIFLVSATDSDPTDIGKLVYSISSGNSGNIFSIQQTSGMLSMSCNGSVGLDRETKDMHTLTVKVVDSAGHQNQAVVNIRVKDENDTPPQFVGLPYIASVNEGPESSSLRISISAIDLDLDSNVNFKFLTTYPHFNITTSKETSPARGEIMVVRQLDREAVGMTRLANGSAVYNLVVVAVDKAFPALSSTTTVTVLVGDINDNAPKFNHPAFEVTLSEGTPVGTVITKVEASDADVGSELSYSFITDGPFQMRRDTGDVIVADELSTVAGQIMELQISVTDGTLSSNGILIVRLVDANNNDPRFERSSYQFSVPENDLTGQLGMFVGKVSAYDLDLGANGRISYFITSKTDGEFHINQDTGEITVTGLLDRETKEIHNLVITAKDDGSPSRKSTCEVEIVIGDVNDNPPVFEELHYVGQLTEHSPSGTRVSVLGNIKANDKDSGFNAQVLYSLHGTTAGLFNIDEDSGVITVGDAGQDQLDREMQKTIELQIRAADQHGSAGGLNATTSLLIYLLDINDHPPRFSGPFRFTVSESVSQYHPVGVVTATDPDGSTSMTYAVIGGGDGNFYIDRNNGTLYMIGSLDFETKSVYNLNVSVNDNGLIPHSLSAYTLVTVSVTDENDNNPVFLDQPKEMSVLENQAAGTIVGRTNVTDADSGNNAKVTFSLSDAGPFAIDENTGVVTATAKLDREGQASYNLLVLATDNGSPSLSTMASYKVKVTDTNDHEPWFGQNEYTVSMAEGSPVGSVVLLSKASDNDEGQNAQLMYSLSSNSGVHQYFSVDQSSAVVSLLRPISRSRWLAEGLFDREPNTVSMVITATDRGQPPRSGEATIKVQLANVADSSPRFSLATYEMSIVENVPEETIVGQVRATSSDADLKLAYSLPRSASFSIHPDTGFITTKRGLVLDREIQDFYSFTVKVIDNAVPPRSAFALVSLKVTDENDNAPVFSQPMYNLTVNEDIANIPAAIGQITALDPDLDNNAKITYTLLSGNTGGVFILDDTVGVLAVGKELDRESLDVYNLTIQATDNGNPPRSSTVAVSVHVLDENDNVPKFEGHPYEAELAENGPAGQEVAAVYASDADIGPAGTVVYELLDQDTPFYLQARDGLGLVYTQRGLDYEATPSYNLTIMAHDLGTPSLYSLTYIFINVTDVPDAIPHFDRDMYNIYVQDSLAPGSEVFTFDAGQGNFIYEILGGNFDRTFMLNATTGRLLLMKPLDYDKEKNHELIVVAYASGRRRDSHTTKINVEVVESQPVPEFPQSHYTAKVMENSAAPQLVLDLNTYEELAGVRVKYFIVNEDPNLYGLFNVEPDTGELWVTRSLDRELKPDFRINVGCQQLMIHHERMKRQIREFSQVEVVVEVGDLNDNPPVFVDKPVIVGVQQAASFTDPVTKLKVYDPDTANSSSLVFSIIGGADFDYFHLEPHTGVLFPKMNFRLSSQYIYHIVVNVTDDWGLGYSDQTDVKILVLTGKHTAVLVAKIPPPEFQAKQDILMKNLSQIIDLQLNVEKLEPHIVSQDGRPSVDITRTDAYFHGIDRETERAVHRDDIMRKIAEHAKEIEELFGQFFVQEVRAAAVSGGGSDITGAEIALIIIACVIFCGAVLGVCIVCLSHSKHRVSKLNQTAPSYATLSRQALNPDSPPSSSRTSSETSSNGKSGLYKKNGSPKLNLYADNIGFQSDSPDGKNGLAHPDLIDGPTYCMFLPDADSVSNQSYQENPGPLQFVSYDNDGKPVLVVDHEPGGSGYGHQPWTSPYTGDACNFRNHSSYPTHPSEPKGLNKFEIGETEL